MGWLPLDLRRTQPRLAVESFCSEVHADELRHAWVVDLSAEGLRIQRPLGGPRTRSLQLELEVPEIDEVIWAHGEICFDEVWNVAPGPDVVLSGLVRTSGIRVVNTTRRHRRMIEEYVVETRRARRRDHAVHDFLLDASCYLRG
jgi:hypothetical protein